MDDGRGGGGFLLGGRTGQRVALHRHACGWLKLGVVDVVHLLYSLSLIMGRGCHLFNPFNSPTEK